jgi:hypothetical protein
MLDRSLPGGHDRYFEEISELAAVGGFTGEKAIRISKKFRARFPGALSDA